jgi:hypothetical protein
MLRVRAGQELVPLARFAYLRHHVNMNSDNMQSKKRGRPATGTSPAIGVRIPPKQLVALDRWRRDQDDLPGRPEAIRRLIEQALSAASRKKR